MRFLLLLKMLAQGSFLPNGGAVVSAVHLLHCVPGNAIGSLNSTNGS